MKYAPSLLTVSIAANVAFSAVLFFRSPASSLATGSGPGGARTSSATASTAKNSSSDATASSTAGLAADAALGRAFGRFAEKMRAAQAARASDGRWWKSKGPGGVAGLSREQLLAARRELSDAMIAAFGDDLGIGGTDNSQFAFLSPAKREALRRITQDYDEMLAKFSPDGVQLASDREKQKLLRAERDRDIATLLSPAELADYELRTSPSAATVRNRYGDAITSEDDFRKVFALQKAFDDSFPPLSGRVTPEAIRARADGERQLQSDIQSALGDDKYTALRRASDNDMRALDALANRLSLPSTATDNIIAARDVYASESQRINADTSLTMQQRRSQIQDLGNRAKSDVARTLGTEGVDAYAQRSPWLNYLQNGMAFSTTPQASSPGALSLGNGTQSVFPVMPAGANAAGGMRQMIVTGTTSSSGDSGGGTFTIGAPVPAQRENVQVMSFTATSTDSSSSTPAQSTPPPQPTPAQPAPKQ